VTDEQIIVGIDLGTTFSAIAYIDQFGKPEVIANREGDRTTPSVIYFDGENPIVGIEASRMAVIEPKRTVECVKREMGNPSYRFNVDGKDYFPEDLSAMILRKLKIDAEAVLGRSVEKAVISVPAYFKDSQREATKQAGKIAGLDVIRILNEPTAAALAYGLDKGMGSQVILVYDFGGGTFDVTLMKIENREFTILATDGDSKLGGRDIDARLVDWFAEEVLRERGVDLRLDPRTKQDLWDKAEIAKKDLSSREGVSPVLMVGDKPLRVDLDRASFEEMIQDLIQRTRECMGRALAAANVAWSGVDTILLAGGSSRIPAVRSMIAAVAGKDAARDMNPDECVAMGAAIQGVVSVTESEGASAVATLVGGADIVVRDVTSHSLGVKALSADRKRYINSVLIPRNTPIPCERKKTFATNEDNQSRVEIEVLQGEDEDPRSPEVQLIGKAGLGNLPPHKAGDLVIEVSLKYDVDGVIGVSASELMSGQTICEVVMQKSGLLSDDILKNKQAELQTKEL
jgi:molecular chaperone DnaK